MPIFVPTSESSRIYFCLLNKESPVAFPQLVFWIFSFFFLTGSLNRPLQPSQDAARRWWERRSAQTGGACAREGGDPGGGEGR